MKKILLFLLLAGSLLAFGQEHTREVYPIAFAHCALGNYGFVTF